jgi:hypothetical protein
MRSWRCRESEVSRGRRAMCTHFLPLGRPKCGLGEVEKSTDGVFPWPCEIIFCLLDSPKCDLDEVEKAIFQGVTEPEYSFSASWPVQNATWTMSTKRCFKFFHCGWPKMRLWLCRESDDSSARPPRRTHFQPPGRPKIRFVGVEKAMFHGFDWLLKLILCFVAGPKCYIV